MRTHSENILERPFEVAHPRRCAGSFDGRDAAVYQFLTLEDATAVISRAERYRRFSYSLITTCDPYFCLSFSDHAPDPIGPMNWNDPFNFYLFPQTH
jgi:hypothetical protein